MAKEEELQSARSRADYARAHELYRYFQPPEDSSSTLSAHEASSPDTTLTALAQLCAIRLNAKRAMISVIDRHKQYFIAEATKSLDLVDNNKSEVEGDRLWIGCGSADKHGRLCEKTIELPPSLGSYSCFTVKDLSQDGRFNQLPFVVGPPHFKFYVGTPLTTKKGINIGSLFILDDIVRDRLRQNQEQFLGVIAETVMKHMEMAREAQDRDKVMRLSMGMNAFVEGRRGIDPKDLLQQDTSAVSKASEDNVLHLPFKKRSKSGNRSLEGSPVKDQVFGASQAHADINEFQSDAEHSCDDSDSTQVSINADSGHRMTFARAAHILCQSLDVRERGGVVFFDTTSRLRTMHDSSDSEIKRNAPVLSYSTREAEMGFGDKFDPNNVHTFSPIDESLLSALLSRHRRGKMWTFYEDGNISSEEDASSPSVTSIGNGNRKESRVTLDQAEISLLQNHFPGVRQILFSGLWDAGSNRWFTAGFAWTISNRQIFTKETELNHFVAFGNSVMAEVSRLASIKADSQKADFIGSISHELRSPLHGILASAEFLVETEVDGFQSSLVDTIMSCGRTLLDTINHILDYSKINSFERNWRNVRKPGAGTRGQANRRLADKERPPVMNIFATVDVAAITEEVVEGVFAGQVYQDISSTEVTDFSTAARAEAVDRGIARKRVDKVKEIEVHIDIAHDDYIFTTQPGALKRVIMNVFGNALKYTTKGSIMVSLSLDASDDNTDGGTDERMVVLKVTDTGKGISSEYLRTSLFNPFCQEDPLASGTGLGLSIVRSIVTMLRGNIDIRSEIPVGTEVIIRLPLSRLPGTNTPVSTPSSSTTEGPSCDAFRALRVEHAQSSVLLRNSDDSIQRVVLTQCIENWLGLSVVPPSLPGAAADICVLDEKELTHLTGHRYQYLPTVVLCNNATRTQIAFRHDRKSVTEYISKPVGPRKLAKAIQSCLERARLSKLGLAPTIAFSDEESPLLSEADTVRPDLGMEHLTLENEHRSKPLEVQTNGIVTAIGSENAQMAIDDLSATSSGITITKDIAFPFPSQEKDRGKETIGQHETLSDPANVENARYRADLVRRDSKRPPITSRMTEPLSKISFPHVASMSTQYDNITDVSLKSANQPLSPGRNTDQHKEAVNDLTVSNMAMHNRGTTAPTLASEIPQREKRPPRLLLVDDNKINLRLLETYMRKRKYQFIDSAENGQLAVQAAEAHESGYDIIFMDISMPVMNGFEATRVIRDIEDARNSNISQGLAPTPAFIVALTGLASSRDQTEAFESGVDLFMTKPVSFKEVGKLLHNWESHGGLKRQEKVESPRS